MDDETIEQITTSESDKPIQTNLPDNSSFHLKSSEEQLLSIFKLNSDCFKNLLDQLALKDLCSLRETCKQFTRIVDFFVEQNYPALRIGCRKIDVFSDDYHFTELDANSMKVIKKIYWITLNSNIHFVEHRNGKITNISNQWRILRGIFAILSKCKAFIHMESLFENNYGQWKRLVVTSLSET